MTPHRKLPTHTAERVLSAFRGGSSWPILVRTRGGSFVAKLRGAAQGLRPLIAEIVVGELAAALEIPVPERALIELPPDVPSDDRRDELLDLLDASRGTNLGFRYLDRARDMTPREMVAIDDTLAARVLWLDGLATNVDRSAASPNVLSFHGAPWFIDFGASLTFSYKVAQLSEETPREPGPSTSRHLFARLAPLLREVDEGCAARLHRGALESAVALVPEAFLAEVFPGERPDRMRALYVAFLWKRLRPPRPFVAGP